MPQASGGADHQARGEAAHRSESPPAAWVNNRALLSVNACAYKAAGAANMLAGLDTSRF